ncbi:DUF6634 family protein [Rhizobium leguminosarum]|uniref:DUF6634 family protein n=2 Tax=Rhizobium/Agrobacterium group TaxID=227290 RepID=UPI0028F401FE|nr:DUF6634 family protein [Rhizobium leguminosarum]
MILLSKVGPRGCVQVEHCLQARRVEAAMMDEFGSLESRWRWSTAAMTIGRLRSLADDLEAVAAGSVPERPAIALMTSWSFGTRATPCLVGHAFGHPNISDGRPAYSSELFYLDPERGIARTMSRWYRLGTRVDPEYWEERLRENGPSEYSH